MKILRFIPFCLVLLFAACNKGEMNHPAENGGQTASLRIDLSADLRNETVAVKSGNGEEISVDDFWIEIFNSDRRRIYCEKYVDAKDDVLNVNTGEYRLLAKHGDSLGVGFGKAFYMADVIFPVEQAENTVSAVAKLSNVKAKVIFKENIQNTNFYGDCYAVLKNKKYKNTVKFKKSETRAGYIPAGELVLYIYVMMDGELKYYPVEAKTYSPNDFVTFTVEASERYGEGLTVEIVTDDTLNETVETVEIPALQALPAAHPEITATDFDANNDYQILEGDEEFRGDLELAVKTQDPITSLLVEVESEALDLPESFDLMNLDADTRKKLEDSGFIWYFTSTNTAAVLDLENVARHIAWNMPYDGTEETKVSKFRITVTDQLGHTDEEDVTITWNLGSKSTVSAVDYNIWATRIVAPRVDFTLGNPKYSVLEYSQDGVNWSSLGKPKKIDGMTAIFKDVEGLQAGVPCQFRVVYKDKFFPRGEAVIATELPQQLGNAGFEDWTTQAFDYKVYLKMLVVIKDEEASRDWYRPWISSEDKWWDVNSKKTMPSQTTPDNQEYKNIPTVFYSSDAAAGSYSAQLISTYICNLADASNPTSDFYGNFVSREFATAAGEIFIGTANDDGTHKTEGHTFSSRPSSLSFRYKYLEYNGDSFHVYMDVKDADGNIMASKEYVSGVTSDEWEELTLEFGDYAVKDRKAASIYVCIRSTKRSDSEIEFRKLDYSKEGMTVPGGVEAGYVGSILYIDDLKLNY